MITLYLHPTSLTEIKKLISDLQTKKSTGIDEIPPTILKSTSDNILIALTHVFNLSLACGKFIFDFKTAKLAPIYKKGSVTNVCNYRPISLLRSMSKILKKLIYNRVVLFLKKQNFFYKYQFGFRKNHSTSHATSLLIENIAEAFENKEHVLGLFLDLSKAGFPKLLVHGYPLDIVAGLHVTPKFCDVSLKTKSFQLESATNFPQFMPKIKVISEKKSLHFESDTNFPNSCRKSR